MASQLQNAPLGKKSQYINTYSPELLFPILRSQKRQELGICEKNLPFIGQDSWMGYEISWLNDKGKPQIAVAEFIFPCSSSHLIESKSFKLYLNSFNQSVFESASQVKSKMMDDLTNACRANVVVNFISEQEICQAGIQPFNGFCLDHLDVKCDQYEINPDLLQSDDEQVNNEILYSNLLKSNCLVTGQPDWGTIWVQYSGKKINHESFLKYVVSFRNHNEFHEQCVERIFSDLNKLGCFNLLSVYARYTRRGGLDINPFRSTHLSKPDFIHRLFRQ